MWEKSILRMTRLFPKKSTRINGQYVQHVLLLPSNVHPKRKSHLLFPKKKSVFTLTINGFTEYRIIYH